MTGNIRRIRAYRFLLVPVYHKKVLVKKYWYRYWQYFLARDSIYAIARYMPSPVRLSVRPSVCLSVCLSVCHTGGSVKDVWS